MTPGPIGAHGPLRGRRALAALLALWLALAAPGMRGEPRAAAPRVVQASYHVLMNGTHVAVMNERFEARDGAYRIVSESSAVGLLALFERQPLVFVSSGELTASGLRPSRFEGKRSDTDPRRVRAEFDWPSRRLVLSRGGSAHAVPLPPGTQDRLSMMYQFMFRSFEPPRPLDFPMTNGRKLDHYRYLARDGVEIETALGPLEAVHLVKQRGPDEDGAEIWLSPRHHYLPVRVLIEEKDGARYEQVIVGLELRP